MHCCLYALEVVIQQAVASGPGCAVGHAGGGATGGGTCGACDAQHALFHRAGRLHLCHGVQCQPGRPGEGGAADVLRWYVSALLILSNCAPAVAVIMLTSIVQILLLLYCLPEVVKGEYYCTK